MSTTFVMAVTMQTSLEKQTNSMNLAKTEQTTSMPVSLMYVKYSNNCRPLVACVYLYKLNMQGYYKPNLFIVTQAPLSDTMADMWKMVYEQNVNAIVNLARPHEYEQVSSL